MNRFASIALAPFGWLYGAVARSRLALYRRRLFAAHHINAPVMSVGNLTIGGSGKTPLVAWLARAVANEGKRVCVLTRGYGRAQPRKRVIVSDGQEVFAEAHEAGDEARLLAEMLRGAAAVISDKQRAFAAQWAISNLCSEVFILDDGFQHLAIKRDLDIVTVDATNPWGNRRLLPHGRLREPVSELKRADCVVITRADLSADIEALRAEIRQLTKAACPVLLACARIINVSALKPSNEEAQASHMSSDSIDDSKCFAHDFAGQPVAAFCALGNARAFFAHLERAGFVLKHTRAFRDHHVYTQQEVEALAREAINCGASALVTTAKDAVKLRALRFALPCYVVEIEFEFDDAAPLLNLVRRTINAR